MADMNEISEAPMLEEAPRKRGFWARARDMVVNTALMMGLGTAIGAITGAAVESVTGTPAAAPVVPDAGDANSYVKMEASVEAPAETLATPPRVLPELAPEAREVPEPMNLDAGKTELLKVEPRFQSEILSQEPRVVGENLDVQPRIVSEDLPMPREVAEKLPLPRELPEKMIDMPQREVLEMQPREVPEPFDKAGVGADKAIAAPQAEQPVSTSQTPPASENRFVKAGINGAKWGAGAGAAAGVAGSALGYWTKKEQDRRAAAEINPVQQGIG